MHKYNFILSLLFVTGLLLGATSCEDFVYRYPRASMAAELALADIDGIEATLAGLYSRMQAGEYNHREMNLAGELMADQMDIAQTNHGRMNHHPYNREGDGFGIWTRAYNDINRINSILYYIDNVEGVSEARVNQAKGEAYAMRGYYYFDLLKIYARPYLHQNPLVQGEPLGVVYKELPFLGIDETSFQARGTINEGYQMVLDDFTTALTYLNENNPSFPYRFTNLGVQALLARLHLFMGNWSQAASYAEDVINHSNVSLVDAEDYLDAFANAPGAESIFELGFTQADRPGMNTSVGGMATYFPDDGIGYGDVILRQDLLNLLEEYRDMGDVRADMFYYSTKGGQDVAYQLKYNSYRGERYWDDIKVIRAAEMYFIAAEAYVEMEEFDDARDLMNELRAHRGSPDIVVADNKEDFIEFIMTEKRVEFFSEMSHRWFDLRRRGMDIPKGVEGVDQGTPLEFEDYRVVDRIPTSEISSNENMIQNPGY